GEETAPRVGGEDGRRRRTGAGRGTTREGGGIARSRSDQAAHGGGDPGEGGRAGDQAARRPRQGAREDGRSELGRRREDERERGGPRASARRLRDEAPTGPGAQQRAGGPGRGDPG